MDVHFFTFQKVINNVGQPIYIDVIVRGDFSFKAARLLAEQEMAEWREGYRLVKDRTAEQRASGVWTVDYRFVQAY